MTQHELDLIPEVTCRTAPIEKVWMSVYDVVLDLKNTSFRNDMAVAAFGSSGAVRAIETGLLGCNVTINVDRRKQPPVVTEDTVKMTSARTGPGIGLLQFYECSFMDDPNRLTFVLVDEIGAFVQKGTLTFKTE